MTLLREVKDNDFEIVNDCLFNNTFKYKLISMYYVEKVIPVVTTVALNAYCDHIGLVFNENEEMIYRNLALKRFMEMNPKTSEWSTVKMMRFMDWLWRHNLYLDKESTMDINTPRKPKIIKPDYNHRMVVVCSNCGYEFIKAPRCPECGQLQDYGD